ncbi:MAG: (2Fe-2S) ferredoxin domain-containing protein [Myxococcaceae bacterium]
MPCYRMSVCRGPDCRRNGAERVFAAAREALAAQGLEGKCVLARGGCYGLCHLGPNVVVREQRERPHDVFAQEDFQLMGWPDEVHYGEMTADKATRVIAEHVGTDAPVQELRGARED